MSFLTPFQALELARGHHLTGRTAEAETICRRLLDGSPGNAEALHLLGQIAGQTGRMAEGADLIARAIAIDPRPHYRVNLSNCLAELGCCDEAAAQCEAAIAVRPNLGEAHFCLGIARARQGRHEEAITAYQTALRLLPALGEGYANLGLSLIEIGRLDDAIASYHAGLRGVPRSGTLANNLAMALRERGDIDESLGWLRRSLEWEPGRPYIRSNLVLYGHYHGRLTTAQLAEEMRVWRREHEAPLRPSIAPHANDRSPERRLRVGFVSSDLREHVVGRALLPVFEAIDRERFDLACYSGTTILDPVAERYRRGSMLWREVALVPDDQLARQIREDRIDLLVDLALHTAGGRLPVFARKPAPVQVSWLGYPGSAGLDSIDYRITDPFLEPPGSAMFDHAEQPLRLPHCWTPYAEPADSPPVGDLPAARDGHVTFGSFNNAAKLNDTVLALWAEILRLVPDSRLLLISKTGRMPQAVAAFERRGVAAGRIEFLGYYPDHDVVRGRHRAGAYLDRYGRIDIALDPFPYNGMTTTCDALWMGVPVVALIGTQPLGRASFSLLSNVGLPEFAAPTAGAYVSTAVSLAADLPRLTALRATLRERMQRSPLLDHRGLARDLEAALRACWRRRCEEWRLCAG